MKNKKTRTVKPPISVQPVLTEIYNEDKKEKISKIDTSIVELSNLRKYCKMEGNMTLTTLSKVASALGRGAVLAFLPDENIPDDLPKEANMNYETIDLKKFLSITAKIVLEDSELMNLANEVQLLCQDVPSEKMDEYLSLFQTLVEVFKNRNNSDGKSEHTNPA